MKELKKYTKAQLIEAINKAAARNPGFMYYIHSALDDMEYEQEREYLDKAEEALQEEIELTKQYNKLLEPYQGCKLSDLPNNVIFDGAELERKIKAAQKRHQDYIRKVK